MKVYALQGTNGKAIVALNSGEETLTSYNTEVAKYDTVNNKMEVYGIFSATTLKHIKIFLQQNGYPKMTKQQIIKEFNITENV